MESGLRRRDFIAAALASGTALGLGPAFLRNAFAAPAVAGAGPYGPLQAPNAAGLMLPAGFDGHEIARGGKLIGTYPWHFAADGAATFKTNAGGWILVSNSEVPSVLGGGSSAIRFAPDGSIERAYRILAGSNMNCAGGPTPWGTWLSGEEHPAGMIWEADPAGVLPPQPRPALGNFAHEAAAVDPVHGHVYLTEDEPDGCFYRFTPASYPDLTSGLLEVAAVGAGGAVTWKAVPSPNLLPALKPTRQQVPEATRFNGGEGLWFDEGTIYFTTKGDKKVWIYDTNTRTLDVLFDRSVAPDSSLDAVDNVTVTAAGDVYVCEDGGNMEIGIITPDRVVSPFVRATGAHQAGSEIAGVAFAPTGLTMYFSSQRAYPYVAGTPLADGALYQVTGPFRLPEGGVPASKIYGPPAGERSGALPRADRTRGLAIAAARSARRERLSASGLAARVRLQRGALVHAVLRTAELETRPSPRWREDRPVLTTLARADARLSRGTHSLDLAPTRALRSLPRDRDTLATLTVTARAAGGTQLVTARSVRISG